MTRRELQAAAIRAHARGDTWATFWATVAGDVLTLSDRGATPWGRDNAAYRKLVARLSHLVTAGDTDGMTAAGDVLTDDQPEAVPGAVPIVSDTETAARCLWRPIGEATA
jgi:uncharacterized protein YhfF